MLRLNGYSIYDFSMAMNTATVTRGKDCLGEIKVIYNKDEQKIDFPPDSSILPQAGDVVSVCGKNHTITDVYEERPFDDVLYAYVASFKEPRRTVTQTQIFNVTNANQSIIGSQQTATLYNTVTVSSVRDQISNIENKDDAALLNTLLDRFDAIKEDNQPVSKGTFAKYSDVLAKYAPIASEIAGLVLQWLSIK